LHRLLLHRFLDVGSDVLSRLLRLFAIDLGLIGHLAGDFLRALRGILQVVGRHVGHRFRAGPVLGLGCGGVFFGLVLLALLSAGAAAWFIFLPAGPAGETFVEIPIGSTSTQIGAQLEKAGVVRSRYAFDLVRMYKRGVLKAGEYRFDHAVPVTEVYSRILRGDVFTLPVTIPEGATRFEIAARVEQAGLAKREDFLTATVNETALIADLDPNAKSLEGYLFPDTYRFPRKATGAQIAAAMVRRFRAEATQAGLTGNGSTTHDVHSVVTLASLV